MNKIIEGQEVWVKPIGNAARRSNDVVKLTVSKVARKYFHLSDSLYGRFFIDDLTQDAGDYMPNYKVYLSENVLMDEKEHAKLSLEIYKYFTSYSKSSLPLEKLIQISEIINL